MTISRRDFLMAMQAAAVAGLAPKLALAKGGEGLYNAPKFGNVRLLHLTDIHAQLSPVHFREPNVNLGIGANKGKVPHLVGQHFLDHFGVPLDSRRSHAFTYLNYTEAAQEYGKLGGFAHLKTLIDQLREQAGAGNSLLLDGGDLWQGSGTAYWTNGEDMVEASNRLGIDILTAHWEFTYPEEQIRKNLSAFKGEFVAQNVFLSDEAMFMGAEAYDEASGRVFKPYTIRELGGKRVAIIGQAFPYTPIANPSYFIPDWRMGIRENEMQALVNEIRENEKVNAVVVLSHNGMDVDLKMASRVTGIDAILGGHTHDAVPQPTEVSNPGGKTLVSNAGTNGKYVAVLDLDIGNNGVRGYEYKLLPVFSDLIKPDPDMVNFIQEVRAPYMDKLGEKLAIADELLYRRGNFNGTMDQVICDAQRKVLDAQIALSPGFRWGTTVLPGDHITMDDVMNATAITYPETYVREMSGADLKLIMEDVADNLFNKDPYYQQGGDMVRVGGMDYTCDPTSSMNGRISDMRLDNGEPIEANKMYKVAGWATVNSRAPGRPIWDVVADYLRSEKTVKIDKFNTPKLKNVEGNPGLEDYAG
ncbi:thiosulfohydrolase SoxB [Marinobacter pelagius]|uniref:Sulfur-oxidizing protein SoxB n=1 Tax=Marinobacter pelagius TaxID=379482 RepID=A0A1I4ZL83_9GAMM|nr:thiosulfohydrolase SoxB [Marinobacter pelagius]SFN50720.1 sulfur-oxidizing protein SoxB [Marinobacter pelagius]